MIWFLEAVWALMLTWPFLVVLALTAWTFEHNECHVWTLWWWIGAVVIGYFYFQPGWIAATLIGVGYIPVGISWSIWRYNRHVGDEMDRTHRDAGKAYSSEGRAVNIRILKDTLHPKRMKATLVMWVLLWPPSAVDSVAGDLIDAVDWLVRKVFHFAYMGIYDKAMAKLPEEDEVKERKSD